MPSHSSSKGNSVIIIKFYSVYLNQYEPFGCLKSQKPSLHQRWEGFLGEKKENEEPVFSLSRSSIIGRSSVVVQVYGGEGEEYQIEGSFSQRRCIIYNTSTTLDYPSKEPVATIKRKVDPTSNVTLGRDVFLLCLKPRFDGAFAMGMVLVLDQMYGDDDGHENVEEMEPTAKDSIC